MGAKKKVFKRFILKSFHAYSSPQNSRMCCPSFPGAPSCTKFAPSQAAWISQSASLWSRIHPPTPPLPEFPGLWGSPSASPVPRAVSLVATWRVFGGNVPTNGLVRGPHTEMGSVYRVAVPRTWGIISEVPACPSRRVTLSSLE